MYSRRKKDYETKHTNPGSRPPRLSTINMCCIHTPLIDRPGLFHKPIREEIIQKQYKIQEVSLRGSQPEHSQSSSLAAEWLGNFSHSTYLHSLLQNKHFFSRTDLLLQNWDLVMMDSLWNDQSRVCYGHWSDLNYKFQSKRKELNHKHMINLITNNCIQCLLYTGQYTKRIIILYNIPRGCAVYYSKYYLGYCMNPSIHPNTIWWHQKKHKTNKWETMRHFYWNWNTLRHCFAAVCDLGISKRLVICCWTILTTNLALHCVFFLSYFGEHH